MHDHPRHTLLAPALILGLSCLVLAPTVLYPWGRDQGMFAYAGHLVRGGAVPFRDFWDTKPPAIYYVYALAEAVFGYTMRAVRLLDLGYFRVGSDAYADEYGSFGLTTLRRDHVRATSTGLVFA